MVPILLSGKKSDYSAPSQHFFYISEWVSVTGICLTREIIAAVSGGSQGLSALAVMNYFRSRSLLAVGLQRNQKNPFQAELCLPSSLGGFVIWNTNCKNNQQLIFQAASYQFRAHSGRTLFL